MYNTIVVSIIIIIIFFFWGGGDFRVGRVLYGIAKLKYVYIIGNIFVITQSFFKILTPKLHVCNV